MPEFIIELGNALYNEETGEAVFKPKIVSRLRRCKDCGWFTPEEEVPDYGHCGWHQHDVWQDDYCRVGEKN